MVRFNYSKLEDRIKYFFQTDNDHTNTNGLRVIDLCYSCFMMGRMNTSETKDWMNDTQPRVHKEIDKIEKAIFTNDMMHPAYSSLEEGSDEYIMVNCLRNLGYHKVKGYKTTLALDGIEYDIDFEGIQPNNIAIINHIARRIKHNPSRLIEPTEVHKELETV